MEVDGDEAKVLENGDFPLSKSNHLDKMIIEFGEYVIDIAPYQRVGSYASDLIFEILLKGTRYMTKANAESHYEALISPVN